MSTNELDKLSVVQSLVDRQKTQKEGAEALGLSTRQIKRLVKRYKEEGALGLVSRKRGKTSPRRHPKHIRLAVKNLVEIKYSDYGPTLAHEKLTEIEGLKISISSVRGIMIDEGLWIPKTKKRPRIFQYRERRSREGEIEQMDGSPHDWFEGRGPKCSLIYTVDDATSKIKAGRFAPSENTWDYLHLVREYVETHGRPQALYVDKHSVFRVNHKNALSGEGLTQFGRAMKELDIKLIYANTPQAKGRIERTNKTLQDRLVKELRAHQISTLEEANAFLLTFIEDYNRRFAVVPKNPTNAHRPILQEHNLDEIFTIKEKRHLSKSLTFQHNNTIYQVKTSRESYALRHAKITIYEKEDGKIEAFYKGKKLLLQKHFLQEKQGEVISSKELNKALDELTVPIHKKPYKPSPRHHWREYPVKQASLVGV